MVTTVRAAPRHRRAVGAIAVAVAAATGACDIGDGRALEAPTGVATEAPAAAPAATTQASLPTDVFTLASPAFDDGDVLPPEHRGGDGLDESPPLRWSGVPAAADSLAIVVVDETAGDVVHWIVADIEPARGQIAHGEVPAGASPVRNDLGQLGYRGPGSFADGPHVLAFRLHALDRRLLLSDGATADEALAEIGSATVATAEVRAVTE